jgi:hypothetical protein
MPKIFGVSWKKNSPESFLAPRFFDFPYFLAEMKKSSTYTICAKYEAT